MASFQDLEEAIKDLERVHDLVVDQLVVSNQTIHRLEIEIQEVRDRLDNIMTVADFLTNASGKKGEEKRILEFM